MILLHNMTNLFLKYSVKNSLNMTKSTKERVSYPRATRLKNPIIDNEFETDTHSIILEHSIAFNF